MFFRREKPRNPTFQERIENTKKWGFAVQSEGSGKVRVSRDGCAAVVEDRPERPDHAPHVNKAGLVIGNEIGLLVHGGYQTFWRTPDGRIAPALAQQLKALHRFEEDLKEALGLVSLYNEALGTTCDQHMYDRLLNRDHPAPAPAWERKPALKA